MDSDKYLEGKSMQRPPLFEKESIDSGFARFNTIITSLKALDEGFSSKNYVRKFLRALHPKWRAKVTAIEESKDLSSLALDELIGNLKVHEVVMKKEFKIYRGKKERVKTIALKAKKEQPREEKKSFRQRDEKKGKSDRKCFSCGDLNHLIGDCLKPPRNKDQKAFIGGSWSDSENESEDKTNDETCLMAQSSNEVTLDSSHYSDNASSLDDDSLEFDSSKASTSRTIPINFVGPSIETSRDGSTIEQTDPTSRFMDPIEAVKKWQNTFSSPLMSSRSDFVITRKKLIHNKIEESKKPSLKPSLKSGLGYVKTDSRSKTPPPRRNNSSQ
ncbi:zf-CCHC domain-containing protein [Tanacetum coccineum]|uniref:Zf-CCHC domain-containing protein n=1 Tax=Tanacetum coccineum TaxID=301880 RepID=A0ABQ5ELK5_9ASTR